METVHAGFIFIDFKFNDNMVSMVRLQSNESHFDVFKDCCDFYFMGKFLTTNHCDHLLINSTVYYNFFFTGVDIFMFIFA